MKNQMTLMMSFISVVIWMAVPTHQSPATVVSVLQVSPNQEEIVLATVSGTLQIYDAENETITRTLETSGDYIVDAAWSPDGSRVAAITYSGSISIWISQSEAKLFTVAANNPYDFEPELTAVSWSPDGEILAVSGMNLGTILLDANTGEQLHTLQTGETQDNAWSPSADLATASAAGVFVWRNGALFDMMPSINLTGVPGVIPISVAFSPGGGEIAVEVATFSNPPAGNNSPPVLGTVIEFREYPSFTLVNTVGTPTAGIGLEYSNNGSHVAIASFDNTLRIWDVASLQLVDEIPISSGTRGFDWLDTNTVAVGVDNGRFNITEIEGITSDLTGTITLPSRTQGTAAYAVPLSVKLANSGGALVSEHSPTTDVNGTFTLQDLPQGSYGVWLKHDQSLAVMPSVSLDAPAVSLDFGTLAMGDANNSNHVNISDFSILSAAYGKSQGQSGYDARADFNGDNSVGTVDFSLLGSSYGQSGVPQPGIGGTGAFAAPPPTGTVNVLLRPANARARVGQTFTVTLRVRAGTQTVAGAAAYLTYDPALLQ
ncbi:MAG: hypothetical protein HUU31_25825, partial [Anaerolineae bacterium]|nr:hypothetical protein [Anaerolineae bacterium]